MLLKNSELTRFGEAAPWSERSQGGLADARDAIVALFWTLAAAAAARRARRQTLRTLGRLSDRALEDIGVSRDDLPGWTDPRSQGWSSLPPWRS